VALDTPITPPELVYEQ